MKMHWIVCNSDGWRTARGENADKPESFNSFGAAEKQAKEIAASYPGEDVAIYQAVGIVTAPVAPAKTLRWRVLP